MAAVIAPGEEVPPAMGENDERSGGGTKVDDDDDDGAAMATMADRRGDDENDSDGGPTATRPGENPESKPAWYERHRRSGGATAA